MKYNPQKHNRRSIRLKGYNYSRAGLYFVTICTQNRACLFGDIVNGEMIINDAGEMVEHWYYELENKFHDMKCRTMVVMPNHFHCMIEIVGAAHVRADLRVCPNDSDENRNDSGKHTGSPLPKIIQWFKTMTTNAYIRGVKNNGWQRFDRKLWQRNYWEHIVRNQHEYQRIAQYIIDNPRKWYNDKLNNGDGNKVMESSIPYHTAPWMI